MSDGPDRPWTDDPNAGGAGQPPAGSPPPSGSGAPGYGAPPPTDPNAAPPADSGGQPPVGYGGPPPAGYGGPPPGAPQVGMPTATAGLGARIGARILDFLLVGIPAGIVLGIILRLNAAGWISGAVVSLLWFGYFVLMESNQGATIGKRLLNLRVVGADGHPPSMEQAAKRNVWMLIGLVPWIGGFLSFIAMIAIIVTISSDAANRGLHDQFAETAVMR